MNINLKVFVKIIVDIFLCVEISCGLDGLGNEPETAVNSMSGK